MSYERELLVVTWDQISGFSKGSTKGSPTRINTDQRSTSTKLNDKPKYNEYDDKIGREPKYNEKHPKFKHDNVEIKNITIEVPIYRKDNVLV